MNPITLYPHQIEAAEHLEKTLQTFGSALDASDTGTGKTITALTVAQRLGLPVGVVCPKSVIPSWESWAGNLKVDPQFVLNYEQLRTGKTPWVARKGAVWTWAPGPRLLIWDEVHKCKGLSSQNSRMLIAAKQPGILNLMLSATAASNSLDFRALGYQLELHRLHDFWRWAFNHGVRRNRWNGFEFKGNSTVLSKIHGQIFPARGYRARIKDLGDTFPENQIIAQSYRVESTATINKLYEEAAEALKDLKERRKDDDKTVAMTKLLRARQESEIRKIPTMVELTEGLLEEGKQVAIFVNFSQSITALKEMLKTDCIIQGGQAAEVREQNRQDFQSGTAKIIICNLQAGGVGISLHDDAGLAPRVSLISPTFSAVDLKQTLGRIHRAGAKSKCVQIIMFAAGTVEEAVCGAVKDKLSNLDILNDNDTNPESWLTG